MPICKQSKCIFNRIKGCPVCNECGSEPNIVDDNCVSCHNCMYDLDYIRGSIGKNTEPEIKKNRLITIKVG